MSDISTIDNFDIKMMKKALGYAKKAYRAGEAPVGAVIVCEGEVIACGRNMREIKSNALCHAEIIAINRACKRLKKWRLSDCDMYVTLEPCPMCAGAAVNARLRRIVFGAYDMKAGAFGSKLNLNDVELNHKPEISGGVLEAECAKLLSNFFKELRNKKKTEKVKI